MIELIASRPNLCKQLHLPAQSGDDETLERMERGYTRDLYLRLVDDIRHVLPSEYESLFKQNLIILSGVSLTSDFIAGFCGETEQAHQNTLSLIRAVRYSFCFVFPYSMRGVSQLLKIVPIRLFSENASTSSVNRRCSRRCKSKKTFRFDYCISGRSIEIEPSAYRVGTDGFVGRSESSINTNKMN